ncbi:MAG: hypothetical protein FWC71_05680 [Defluviitaleaceae bacterium]|nr:hypothetical protein [Defluviitaleaceae bacterium]
MFNDTRVYLAILMYMFGGMFMMAFNFVEMYRVRIKELNQARIDAKWRGFILLAVPTPPNEIDTLVLNAKHIAHLHRKLKNASNLLDFARALTYFKEHEEVRAVFDSYMGALRGHELFHWLAFSYKRAKMEERAYFAYFISLFPEVAGNTYSNLMNQLIGYINNSNIYCRTNVIKALCRIGNQYAVIKALDLINDREYYMYGRFLADELMAYKGDREELALTLWAKYGQWSTAMMDIVIIYIKRVSGSFKNVFMPLLTNDRTDTELRMSIIRYYKQYRHDPAHDTLIALMFNEKNINLSIVATDALSAYPGTKTAEALHRAIKSRNWYIRYHAAVNLVDLSVSIGNYHWLDVHDDQYAMDIVRYVMQLRNLHVSDLEPQEERTQPYVT